MKELPLTQDLTKLLQCKLLYEHTKYKGV